MSTITLPNIRVFSDLTVKVRLKDGGVAIDWSTLSNLRAWIYSDAQSSFAGRCDVTVDGEDATLLVCRYAATRMQYLGVNRIVVSARYMGAAKTYDKPVLNFVRWTEDQAGEQITIEDPEVTVEIDVEDISSSILQEAVDAAFSAAVRADEAAAAAEHMVDIHQGPPGPAGKAPYVDATTGNWFVWDDTEEAYVDSGNPAQGPAGNGIASWSVVESQEDGGSNVVTVVFTNGESESFTVKNGSTGATPNLVMGIVETGAAGSRAEAQITGTPANPILSLKIPQGEPGVAAVRYIQVDTLPSASSHTLDALYLVQTNTADVFDVYYTTRDGQTYSWVKLCTTSVQLSDYATKAEVTQLEAEVDDVYPLVLASSPVDPTTPTKRNYQINSSNKYTTNTNYKHILIPVSAGNIITVTAAAANNDAQMAWLTDDAAPVSGGTPHFVSGTGRFDLSAGNTSSYTAPTGANFMYFYAGQSPYNFLPQAITVKASKIPSFTVIDNTSSTSTKDALSANQGRLMKEEINVVSNEINIQLDLSLLSNINYGYIGSTNKYVSTSGRYGKFLQVNEGQKYRIVAPSTEDAYYSLLTSNSVSSGGTPAFVTGTSRNTLSAGATVDVIIPTGCKYLQFNTLYDSTEHTPQSVTQIGGTIDKLEEKDVLLQAGVELNADRLAKGKIGESNPSIELTSGHGINCKDGTAPSSDVLSNTDYIALDGISAIELTVNVSTGTNTTRGIAFYDADKNYLRGVACPYDTSLEEKTYTVKKYTVPNNAAYFRTCFYTDFASDFKCTLFRADASENIAALLSEYLSVGGMAVVTIGSPEIYHHPAIESGANATTTAQIYALYDELVSLYPTWFARETDIGIASDGVTEIRHYRLRYNYNAAWSLGDYNNNRWDEVYSWRKILLNAGTHGDEATAIWGLYYFVKALLEGDGEKWAEYIRSNIQLDIIPVLNPYGLDHNQRGNANGVDINRQFDVTSCVEAEALKGVARELLPFAFIDCHTVGTTHGNYLGYLGGPSNGPIHGFLARLVNNLAALFREDWADLASLAGISNKPYIYWCIGQSQSTPERAVAWMTFNITKSAVVCEALNVGSISVNGKPMAKITVDVLANLIPAFMKFN